MFVDLEQIPESIMTYVDELKCRVALEISKLPTEEAAVITGNTLKLKLRNIELFEPISICQLLNNEQDPRVGNYKRVKYLLTTLDLF